MIVPDVCRGCKSAAHQDVKHLWPERQGIATARGIALAPFVTIGGDSCEASLLPLGQNQR